MCGLLLVLDADESKEDYTEALLTMERRGIRYSEIYAEMPGGGNLYMGHVRLPINGLGTESEHPFTVTDYPGVKSMAVGEYYEFYDRTHYLNDSDALASRLISHPEQSIPGMYHSLLIYPDRIELHTDQLGKKPVYCKIDKESRITAIASEIRPLLSLGKEILEIRASAPTLYNAWQTRDRLWDNQGAFIPTGFENIYQFNPLFGHYWEINLKSRWPKSIAKQKDTKSFKKGDLTSLIKGAVEKRWSSTDIPPALLVSGGLDSSIIWKCVEQLDPNIPVFHWADPIDEEFVDLLNIPNLHKLQEVKHVNWKKVLGITESPVDLGSFGPQYQLAEAIHTFNPEINVLLGGDGADELFGGYKRALKQNTRQYDLKELVYYHLPRLDKIHAHFLQEMRSPFLDEDIVQYQLNHYYPGLTGKLQLKKVARELGVPQEIIDRDKYPLKSQAVKFDKPSHLLKLHKLFKEMHT